MNRRRQPPRRARAGTPPPRRHHRSPCAPLVFAPLILAAALPAPAAEDAPAPPTVAEVVRDANLETLPAAARRHMAAGLQAFAKRDYAAAAKAFRSFTEQVPGSAAGWLNVGLAEYRQQHPEAALEALDRALAAKLDFAPAWLLAGILRHERGDLDGATACLAQAVWREPRNPVAHNYLAVTVGAKGWNLGAEQELRKAVELDPNYGAAHFNLAIFYLRRTPPAIELARRHYQRARELGEPADELVEKRLDAAK